MDLSHRLQLCPIIAILRGIRPEEAEALCATLEESGVGIVEVPLNSPEPLESISILSKEFGDRLLIGAGTVTRTEQVAQVAQAGGKLIVMPHCDTSIVRSAKAAGLIAIPGFLSPGEAFANLQAGADAIKLFPAEVVGPAMMKGLQAVLPLDALVVPVGGVDAGHIGEWAAAGARGFGAGASLYRPGDTPSAVQAKARSLVLAARNVGLGVW